MTKKPDSDQDALPGNETQIRQPNDDETTVPESRTADTIVRDKSVPPPAPEAHSLSKSSTTKPLADDSTSSDQTVIRDNPVSGGRDDQATLLRGNRDSSQVSGRKYSESRPSPGGNDNVTEVRPPVGGATILREPRDDGATILRDPLSAETVVISDDATIIRSGDRAAQGGGAQIGDDDSTIINSPGADDSTVIGEGSGKSKLDTTYIASIGQQIHSKGNTEAGRLLKNRFVLEEKVGSGGMGDVYKALDLRQQEAQERNPYIAIKILNDNFARHKDAFISLQREATRTRGIPHPNIMGVYDFDREGDTVFMSMELLDGKPLDDYLKDHTEGVSIEDAWNIIDGVCQGLSRAHAAGIVHSDFKPGNIYYTEDKKAKVFDFGIARAVKNPSELEADGEKTVFDAGTLGALTPAYASYEMLTGKEPAKSDDVYAIALVAYELFTGKHPYNRVPADKALERGLQPEPIPFLKRRHWKVLKKALALKGEDRTQTVDEFREGMFSEDPHYFRYGAIAAVVVGAIGFGVYSTLYGGTDVPEEFNDLRARISQQDTVIERRLSAPRFDSDNWHNDLQVALFEAKDANSTLEEKFPALLDEFYTGTGDRKAEAEKAITDLEVEILNTYVGEIDELRASATRVQLSAVQATNETREEFLRNNLEKTKDALGPLELAARISDIAQNKYKFGGVALLDASKQVETSFSFWQAQQADLENAIEGELSRIAAEELRQAEEEAERLRIEERDRVYQEEHLVALRQVLRCKGDIGDPEIEQLAPLFSGMRSNYPEQYEIDEPGIAEAFAQCIKVRIAPRLPDRARAVKAKMMDLLPRQQAQFAAIEINDLDVCAARSLEGSGISNRSWCQDVLSDGGVGPELVVIPRGVEIKKFAISRMEIRVSDYNLFCADTGCQKISRGASLPVTNISLAQAESYLKWLSSETGKVYRLPTAAEWEYAATTSKQEAVDDNVNCTVDSRGVRLGEKLLNTLSGKPNSWGLYNFVGNAREWVKAEEGYYAAGGAHTDPRSQCTIKNQVAHSGEADPVTGFRVVRLISS